MSVGKLVKRAKNGDKEALLALVLEEKHVYYRLAYSYLGNEHDALDATEDMIVKLYENIHQLRKSALFYSWSKTILVNCCKDLLRKRKKVVLVDEVALNASAPDLHKQQESTWEIEDLLQHVNDLQREAITLRYINDLDYHTIAAMTNVSVGTAKSRVFQGIRKLRTIGRSDVDE